MKKILLLTLTTYSLLFASPFECKKDGTQQEMNKCAYEDFQKADKELNKVYNEVRAKNKGEKFFLTNLKTSQKLWLKFLDAELSALFPCKEGEERICFGSMYGLLYNTSKAELTEERTKQLKRHLINPVTGEIEGEDSKDLP